MFQELEMLDLHIVQLMNSIYQKVGYQRIDRRITENPLMKAIQLSLGRKELQTYQMRRDLYLT